MTKRFKRPAERKSYDVGFGKPPAAHRFKPGQSGNPRGRPRVTPNISEMAAKELKRRRKVTIDGHTVSLSTAEILMKRLIHEALKGNPRAFASLFEFAGPQIRKELSWGGQLELIKATMSPKEAADIYAKTLAQPTYDGDDIEFIGRKKRYF